MTPEELAAMAATVDHRLKMLEQRQDEIRTRELPELLAHGKAWHASLMTAMANLQSDIARLQNDLPLHYSPRPESQERHRTVNERLASLDQRATECRRECETTMDRHQDDHREAARVHQAIHERADDERGRLLYWGGGALLTAGLALVQTVIHFIPGTH